MIDKNTLNAILHLCRIKISAEEKEHFQTQIGDILDYFNSLNNINTENVDVNWDVAITKEELREDVPEKSFSEDEIMEISKNFHDGFFIVPQVLDTASEYDT